MAQMRTKIAWKDVSKRFGDNIILDGLNLEAKEGRSLVIIGGSGTGKSVTLKLALGLLAPDSGAIEIDGRPIKAHHEDDPGVAQVGMLFQSGALFDSLTVWENIAFRLLNLGRMKRPEARKRAVTALEQVDLEPDVADKRPGELSGGMLKRAALARAVVTRPNILFFDEPTTGLDPVTADVINRLIARQVRTLGATAVTVTHDMASMRMIADDVAMLAEGHLAWQGPIEGIENCDNKTVSDFVAGRSRPQD